MKKIAIFSLTLLLSPNIYGENELTRTGKSIVLESEVLHLFDGTSIGVNANTLELIGLIRREMNVVLFGKKQPNGTFIGRYTFEGKNYSLEQIAEIEEKSQSLNASQKHELEDAFKKAREDIKKNFRPFIDSARNTKHHMIKLVEESCRKRNKMNSFLLNWAEQKTGEEEEGFDIYITDACKLKSFCVDLLNFLGDLVRSCPNAQKLFIVRVKKCKKISQLLPQATKNIKNNKAVLQKAFMHYAKEHVVDKLKLEDITPQKLNTLLHEFIQNHY